MCVKHYHRGTSWGFCTKTKYCCFTCMRCAYGINFLGVAFTYLQTKNVLSIIVPNLVTNTYVAEGNHTFTKYLRYSIGLCARRRYPMCFQCSLALLHLKRPVKCLLYLPYMKTLQFYHPNFSSICVRESAGVTQKKKLNELFKSSYCFFL